MATIAALNTLLKDAKVVCPCNVPLLLPFLDLSLAEFIPFSLIPPSALCIRHSALFFISSPPFPPSLFSSLFCPPDPASQTQVTYCNCATFDRGLVTRDREAPAAYELPQTAPSLLNFVVTDGHTVVATRYISSRTSEASSLFFSSGTSFDEFQEGGLYRMTKADKRESIIMIASEPLTFERSEWMEVKTNSMLVITPKVRDIEVFEQ